MIDLIAYKTFRFFVVILQILPRFVRKAFFNTIAFLGYKFAKSTNKTVMANLDLVFENKLSKEEKEEICKYSYFNMMNWGNSLIENLTAKKEDIRKNITIENLEYFENLKKENKKIIIISAHYGNIEMLGFCINHFITKTVQIARQSKNSYYDEFLVNSREKSGSKIVFRKGALKKLVKALMKDEVVSLIIDQHISRKNGTEVEFLGKKAIQSISSATLARKFDAYILPIAVSNQDNETYKIKLYEPIAPIKTDNQEEDLKVHSQYQADALSKIILEDPKQWFWQHKRFKRFYNEIYK